MTPLHGTDQSNTVHVAGYTLIAQGMAYSIAFYDVKIYHLHVL